GKGYAKIGIEAPKSLMILRKELVQQVKDENLHSVVQNDIKLDDLSKKLIK
ncbi:carbon storage regulator, partial [Campylobacter jejuni]|nr:carbon storage regulator [Campylobacter jejuni]